ncbi:hypothetical protein GCM10009682_10180 [Luedemannella flava]|uniref:DUF1232 domain-containing protein n=1 Tax=Luedemannella flava TaxID=349316 RepID=A0ABN2LJ53_9ACTN
MSREAWIVVGVIAVVVAVVTLVWAIRLLSRLFTVRKSLQAMGAKGNLVFWGALIYTIFPIDVLPDPIYLDDVTVLGGALWFLTRLLRRGKARDGSLTHDSRPVELGSKPRQPR